MIAVAIGDRVVVIDCGHELFGRVGEFISCDLDGTMMVAFARPNHELVMAFDPHQLELARLEAEAVYRRIMETA